MRSTRFSPPVSSTDGQAAPPTVAPAATPPSAGEVVDALLKQLQRDARVARRRVTFLPERALVAVLRRTANICQHVLNRVWRESAPAMAPMVLQPLDRWERLVTGQARESQTRRLTYADHEARALPLAQAAALCGLTVYISLLGWACVPFAAALLFFALR